MPSTSSESSTVPPSLLISLISRRSRVLLPGFITLRTESTAMGDSSEEYCDTTLLLKDVVAALIRASLSLRSTSIAMLSRISTPFSAAFWKESEMTVGCTPFSSSSEHFLSSAPQMTTTEVVPSPATTSCDLESSTSILAAGCVTVIFWRMVAPSLVISTSPLGDTTILSMPRGPRLVRTASATALAASILACLTLFFFEFSESSSPLLPCRAC
mmetsp:Transcript_10473/g.26846  ORF Transcript_10473/g.26846 Transcript_10473/m.26846 type:complete len:214 (-) Transcript_10473:1-642(-)